MFYRARYALAAFLMFAVSLAAQASVQYNLVFNDPASRYIGYDSAIVQAFNTAGALWSPYLQGNTTITVQVNFDYESTASSASAASSYVNQNNGIFVFQQGAAGKLLTGVDVNGAAPDANLNIGINYLLHELYFGTGTVPANKTDAVSMFTHELGHIFGFNGFRSSSTGLLPSDYESTFDEDTVVMGGNFYFDGAHAMSVYGGMIPLTDGNIFHVGNWENPGVSLITDLMSGVELLRGTRYGVSALDAAILCDLGMCAAALAAPAPVGVPEPPVWAVFAIGALALAGVRRARLA